MDRRPAWLLTGLLLVAACGGGGGDSDPDAAPTTTRAPGPTTSSTAAPPTTSTSTTMPPVDPSVIPDDPAAIDEAYVEAVANELYRVIGEANSIQVEGADLQGVVDRYNAVYVTEAVDLLLNDALARTDTDLARFKRPTGSQRITVSEVVEATEDCVVARAIRDSSDVLIEPVPPIDGYLVLVGRDRVSDNGLNRTDNGLNRTDNGLNRTAWLIRAFSPEAEGRVSCGAE